MLDVAALRNENNNNKRKRKKKNILYLCDMCHGVKDIL